MRGCQPAAEVGGCGDDVAGRAIGYGGMAEGRPAHLQTGDEVGLRKGRELGHRGRAGVTLRRQRGECADW